MIYSLSLAVKPITVEAPTARSAVCWGSGIAIAAQGPRSPKAICFGRTADFAQRDAVRTKQRGPVRLSTTAILWLLHQLEEAVAVAQLVRACKIASSKAAAVRLKQILRSNA
jgi:hypothetical protein